MIHQLDTAIVAIPVSVENYGKLIVEAGLKSYVSFFDTHLEYQLPELTAYWNQRQNDFKIDDNAELLVKKTDREEVPQEEMVYSPVIEIEPSHSKDGNESRGDGKKEDHKTTINPGDYLTGDQVEIIGKAGSIYEEAGEFMENPVDGIKNLFKKL